MKLLIHTADPLNRIEVADDANAGPGQRVLTEAEWQADYAHLLPVPAPELDPISWAISNADLRRGLISRGINPKAVLAKLETWPESAAKWEALTDFEYSNYVERAHPMLDLLAPEFGLTPADIDEIFRSKQPYPRP